MPWALVGQARRFGLHGSADAKGNRIFVAGDELEFVRALYVPVVLALSGRP